MPKYIGIQFPFAKGSTSFPEAAVDAECLSSSIKLILSTQKGERVMRPTFGSDILRYVFSNNDELLSAVVTEEVSRALAQFEPRIIVRRITTVRADNQLVVSIEWIDPVTKNKSNTEVVQDIPQAVV